MLDSYMLKNKLSDVDRYSKTFKAYFNITGELEKKLQMLNEITYEIYKTIHISAKLVFLFFFENRNAILASSEKYKFLIRENLYFQTSDKEHTVKM